MQAKAKRTGKASKTDELMAKAYGRGASLGIMHAHMVFREGKNTDQLQFELATRAVISFVDFIAMVRGKKIPEKSKNSIIGEVSRGLENANERRLAMLENADKSEEGSLFDN